MTAAPITFDISPFPELVRAIAAARSSGRPLRLVERDTPVGDVVPDAPIEPPTGDVVAADRLEAARAGLPPEEVVRRTAGIFARYRLSRPLTIAEEKEAFAQAVADENARALE